MTKASYDIENTIAWIEEQKGDVNHSVLDKCSQSDTIKAFREEGMQVPVAVYVLPAMLRLELAATIIHQVSLVKRIQALMTEYNLPGSKEYRQETESEPQ